MWEWMSKYSWKMPIPWSTFRSPDHLETSPGSVYSSESSWLNFSAKSSSYKNDEFEDSDYNIDKWKYNDIDQWSPKDVIFWILSVVIELGESRPAALSLENFKDVEGRLLRTMCLEEWRRRLPEYGERLYQRLQMKLMTSSDAESETKWQSLSPVLSPFDQYTIMNLDAQPPTATQPQAQAHILSKIEDLQLSERCAISANSIYDERDPGFQYGNSFSAKQEHDNDSDSSTEEEKPNIREKRPVGRPRRNPVKDKSHRKVGRVWEFIRDLLLDPQYNPSLMRWVNREEGLFRFENSDQVAKLWGKKRGNKHMNFEKFSRSVRHNYKKGYLAPMKNQRLVYKFGPLSYGWQQGSAYRQ